jgi:hypothetical protein
MRTPCPDQQPSGAYVPWRPRRINTARNFLAGSSGVEIRAIVAGGLGFEPRLTESESAVLPLNYPPRARTSGAGRSRHSRRRTAAK